MMRRPKRIVGGLGILCLVACGDGVDDGADVSSDTEAISTGQTLTFPDFTAVQWIAPFEDTTTDDVIGAMNTYAINADLPWRSATADYALLTLGFKGLAASANHDSVLSILPGPSVRSGLGPVAWNLFVERQEFRNFYRQEPVTIRLAKNARGERVVADTRMLANVFHGFTHVGGFTPLAGQHVPGESAVDSFKDSVIYEGSRAVGVERHAVLSARLGAEGRAVNELLTSFGTPRIWMDVDYRAFVDGRYEIDFRASHVPTAAIYVGKTFAGMRKQSADDFGKFMFTGDNVPAAPGLSKRISGKI